MRLRRKIVVVVSSIVVLLVGARLALPYLVKNYANDRLARLDSYHGHIADIDIHLWRGAYSIKGLEIVKTGAQRPCLSSRHLESTCRWNGTACGTVPPWGRPSSSRPKSISCRASRSRTRNSARKKTGIAGWRKCFPFRSALSTSITGTVRFLAPGIELMPRPMARKVEARHKYSADVISKPAKKLWLISRSPRVRSTVRGARQWQRRHVRRHRRFLMGTWK